MDDVLDCDTEELGSKLATGPVLDTRAANWLQVHFWSFLFQN